MQKNLTNYFLLIFVLFLDIGVSSNNVPYEDVNFYFYSQSNLDTATVLRSHNLSDLLQSNFNPDVGTYMVLHGYGYDYSSCLTIKDSFLTAGDFNIFLVDYTEPASNSSYLNYTIDGVALIVSDYVTLVVNHFGLTYDNFTCVGFSLGGHVCGNIGLLLNGELGEIVGLDPGFMINPPYLNVSSAKFVQHIHTSSIGIGLPIGHSNYYPNTNDQPGCDGNAVCSHHRVLRYYEESLVSGGFKAVKCNSSESFISGLCDENETSYLGRVKLDKSASGSYYLETNAESPFSIDFPSSNSSANHKWKYSLTLLFCYIFWFLQ